MQLLAPLLSAVLTIAAGSLLFLALGLDPIAAMHAFFIAPVSSLRGLGELTLKAAPIMICAAGLSVSYRAGVWNIGAEGQLIMGAIAAGALALALPDARSPLLFWAMLVAGTLSGMAWAGLAAELRVRFNANEILVTLMLTYIAGLFLSYLVYGPLRSPTGFNWPESADLPPGGRLSKLMPGTRLNIGILLALAAALVAWAFVARTYLAYQMEVGGLAPRAASYAGFDHGRMIWIGLLASGACAGAAGVIEVAGTIGKLREVVSPGYGYAAIIVAFIGRLHPGGIVLASLLMALLYLGGESAKVSLGLPAAITGVYQGMLLFFLLMCDLTIGYRLRLGPASRPLEAR